MGAGQPYLYDAPKRFNPELPDTYDNFNPKAVTMASRMPKPPPKPKPKGPLIDFNRHPDSYFVLPSGRGNVRPMSIKTKTLVRWARFLQLALRVAQLLGAVGCLLCGIFVRGTLNSEGFLIRIPVGCALFLSYFYQRVQGGHLVNLLGACMRHE